MIKLSIKDDFDNELAIDDIVVCHYPNKKIKFFGILVFDPVYSRFILSDMADEEESVTRGGYKKYQRLGTYAASPGIRKELGRIEVVNITEFDKIFNLCQNK